MIKIEVASQQEIESIIKDDEIYARISDDYSPDVQSLDIPKMECALSGFVNNDLASLYLVNNDKMHFMVLDKHRGNARKLLERSFNYFNKTVYCVIPLCYDNVIKFAINNKFIVKDMVDDYRLIDGVNYKAVVLERKVMQ